MPFISCTECGKHISDTAESCPDCGAPIRKIAPEPTPTGTGGLTQTLTGKEIVKLLAIGLFAIFVFTSFQYGFPFGSGCSARQDTIKPQPPAAQVNLEKKLADIKDEYTAARRAKNRMQENVAMDKMKLFVESLGEKNIRVSNWHCSVIRIRDDKNLSCSHSHITYHLSSSKTMAELFGKLGAGEKIIFSGDINGEKSITTRGAIDNPELEVAVTAVRKL